MFHVFNDSKTDKLRIKIAFFLVANLVTSNMKCA